MKALTLIIGILVLAFLGDALMPDSSKAYTSKKLHASKEADSARVVKIKPIPSEFFTEKRCDRPQNICTATGPAGYVRIFCTVGKALYKGARAAAISGAKQAVITTSLLLTNIAKIGRLISPS